MFEKRPIWGIIFGLNVCVLIWLISVQEPVMFDASTAAISSGSGSSSNNDITNTFGVRGGGGAVVGRSGGTGKRDLLAKQQNNEYNEEQAVVAYSTLTTLTYNNNTNNNSNNNINNNLITNNFSQNITQQQPQQQTSPKTIDDISLTSSLGTGVLSPHSKPTPSWAKLTAVSSALPVEDFNQLIDLHNFQYLMPQPVCSNHIEALILIHSAPKNQEKRQIIRETWGSVGHHMADSPLRVLFLLGAMESQEQQDDLVGENNLYKDIIQGSFIDDYRNMTYKHVMAFKWFLYNCPQAQILIKVDDDVYVNTPQLIKYLKQQQQEQQEQEEETLSPSAAGAAPSTQQQQQYQKNINNNKMNPTTIITTKTTTTNVMETPIKSTKNTLNIFAPTSASSSSSSPSSSSSASALSTQFNASHDLFHRPQNLLFCHKITGSMVKRSYRSKWRVSFKEYSERYYPPYCPGYAIIYSSDVIFRLYKAAQNSKYFWIDDVHITGVLAQQTNTTITTSTHYVLYSDECDSILRGKTDLNEMEFLFAWHSITSKKVRQLWHLQMMSLKTLDELHYQKKSMKKSYHRNNSNQRLAYDINMSSVSSTSSAAAAAAAAASSSSLSSNYISSDGLR